VNSTQWDDESDAGFPDDGSEGDYKAQPPPSYYVDQRAYLDAQPRQARAASARPSPQKAYHDDGAPVHRAHSQAGTKTEFKVFDAFSPQRQRPMALP
jgi:hypothetical protein